VLAESDTVTLCLASYPALDMAAVPFTFLRRVDAAGVGAGAGSGASTFVRFGRRRAGVSADAGGCSGLGGSRAAAFLLRAEGGGRAGTGAVGESVAFELGEAAASLAEERVTLEDMRICLLLA